MRKPFPRVWPFGRRSGTPAAAGEESRAWSGDRPSQRRFRRWETDFAAELEIDGEAHWCRISDISPGGARLHLEAPEAVAVGAAVELALDGFGTVAATVRHSAAGLLGLEFALEAERQVELARWLVARQPGRRQERRKCHVEAAFRTGGVEFACIVTDLSRTGAGLTSADAEVLAVASELTLLLPGEAPLTASIRHVDGNVIGVMFMERYEGELPD